MGLSLVNASTIAAATGIPTWSAGEVELDVLRALWTQRSPMTKRQLQLRTGVAAEDVEQAVANLCACGRLHRLNTLVDAYALPAWG